MSSYREAGAEVEQIANDILEQHYPELVGAGVRFGFLFAHAARNEETGEPKGSAMKHGGYPAAGLCKVTSLEARVAGHPDIIIKLDGDAWPDLSEQRKRALLHHEIHHCELQTTEDGVVQLDLAMRPKLRLQLHDIQIGGFARIAELYGEEAYEVEQVQRLCDKTGQLLLPWAAHEAVAEEVA